MYAHVDKSKENQRTAAATPVVQKEGGTSLGIGFIDNRVEASRERKIKEIMRKGSPEQKPDPVQRSAIYSGGIEVLGTRAEDTSLFLGGFTVDTISMSPEGRNTHIDFLIQRFNALQNKSDWDAEMIKKLNTLRLPAGQEQHDEDMEVGTMENMGGGSIDIGSTKGESVKDEVIEEVIEEEPEAGPIEKLADRIYDGVGGYICGSNLKESGKDKYGTGAVCSDRFDECVRYFTKTLSAKEREGLDFWAFHSQSGEINHVAFCLGPKEWDDDNCWIVDPWIGLVCHINDYVETFTSELAGCEVMVGATIMTGEKFAGTLKKKFKVGKLT